jgi:hypothetical protein
MDVVFLDDFFPADLKEVGHPFRENGREQVEPPWGVYTLWPGEAIPGRPRRPQR